MAVQCPIRMFQMTVPCDCSVAWLADAALECSVSVVLDHLPCGMSNWMEVKNNLLCPGVRFFCSLTDFSHYANESLIISGTSACLQRHF